MPTAEAPVATALRTAATALHESARRHKAAAATHRRSAQADMAALDRLRAVGAALGIRIEIVTAPQEAQTHGNPRR